jgi:hypothetical protein
VFAGILQIIRIGDHTERQCINPPIPVPIPHIAVTLSAQKRIVACAPFIAALYRDEWDGFTYL